MSKMGLVAKPIAEARTRKPLASSKISEPLIFSGRFVMRAYLRFALAFQKIEVQNPEEFIKAVRDFQDKKTRLIVAFRHPYGDEPQLLFHVSEYLLPRLAKKLKTPLLHRPRLRPVHDYAVPLWGGGFIRFILPRVGAVPVYHAKSDSASIKDIRSVLRDGNSPLGIAPEGQISYHSEALPRIEQGTVRIGFWCASELEKAARPEKVVILPLSVHCQYNWRDHKKILTALKNLETLCGLPHAPESCALYDLQTRIEILEDRLLDIAEQYYITFGYKPQTSPADYKPENRQRRWEALLPFAVKTAEHILGLEPKNDDLVQRMYRVRLTGWDRIYPEDAVENLPALKAALAHRSAGEAWYAMRHMELVDLMSYFDAEYLNADNLTYDRIVESVINLQDLAYRLMGGNITTRPNKIRKKAVIIPGPCLNLTDRLADYHENPKQTAQKTTDELARTFENCIKEYLDRNER